MTNKKTLIIKQLAVFVCGIVLSAGEVAQPESVVPETADVLEPGRNFTFTLYNPGDSVELDSPEERVVASWLKYMIKERMKKKFRKNPQGMDPRYIEVQILRGTEFLTDNITVEASDELTFIKLMHLIFRADKYFSGCLTEFANQVVLSALLEKMDPLG